MSSWDVSNSSGTTQFTVTDGEEVRFQGNNDTTITFDSGTQKVIISSTSGASDSRLKKNIKPISNALQKVLSLRGVSFEWNDTGREKSKKAKNGENIGYIAQNVQSVLPNSVSVDEFFKNDQDPNDPFLRIEYGQITSLLNEAIRELDKKINNQQKEIDKIKKHLKLQ